MPQLPVPRPARQLVSDRDLYLLAIHEPYTDPRFTQPINATVVTARTLLHPALPQPDAAMIYRCLTEFPGRTPGELVPLSTITYELDGGRYWPRIGDWAAVTTAIPGLTRAGRCDASQLGLHQVALHLLANGPESDAVMHYTDGGSETLGPADRQATLDDITRQVHTAMVDRPMWPGDHLVAPPITPHSLPYKPYLRQAPSRTAMPRRR